MEAKKRESLLFKKARCFLRSNWKRLLVWVTVAVACGYFCYFTDFMSRYNLPWNTTDVFPYSIEDRWQPHISRLGIGELEPGQSLEQRFKASGNIVGTIHALYVEILPEEGLEATAELRSETTGDVLFSVRNAALDAGENGGKLPDKKFLNDQEDGLLLFTLPEEISIRSGETYCLTLTNTSKAETMKLRVDHAMQSGRLTVAGEDTGAALNFGFRRTSNYYPSGFVRPLIVLTAATVLLGLWLVLFTRVKEHVLYLILAVGFGIVAMFDVTYLFGFDMQYHFDSTYVLSNQLMGLEGPVMAPSLEDPEQVNVHYYRRACDDYTMFQSYGSEAVSDNYTDLAAVRRDLRLNGEEEGALTLMEANQGVISGQLYILYLPQAIGFTIGRLLKLQMIPMVMLGRGMLYAVFVCMAFFAIRAMPFGKRLLMILALTPATLMQTASITRDAMIIALSFFIAAKVLQVAYAERMPTVMDWVLVIVPSALLAPCKAVYLPISFLWLIIVYRKYIRGRRVRWGRVLLFAAVAGAATIAAFSSMTEINLSWIISDTLRQLQNPDAEAGAGQSLSIPYVLSHLSYTGKIMVNTLRMQIGDYFVNALQLFETGSGCEQGTTVLLTALLGIECCCDEEKRRLLGKPERYFSLLIVGAATFLLMLAAMEWSSLGNVVGTYQIYGIQGRYFIPVLPLVGIFLMNNKIVRIKGNPELLVKAGCCVFPAICLMNMYLWTVAH